MCRKNRKKEIEEVEEITTDYAVSLTFKELEALNNELYRVCGEMHENKDFIKDPVLKSVMWKEITKAYMAQSEEIKERRAMTQEIRRWTSAEKRRLLNPDMILVRRFPRRQYEPNEIAKQCFEQAKIEAAMEFAARAAEIERQKEFLTGEPDLATEYFYIMLDGFVPFRKRKRFIKQHYERITRFLSEYAYDETPDRLYMALLNEFASAKKLQQFEEKNGEYLKVLISNFIETYTAETEAEETEAEPPADDTAEPTEPSEASEDTEPEEEPEDESEAGEQLDLSEFEEAEAAELAKQAAAPEPTGETAEEIAEEPVQEQMQLPPVAVAENTAPQTAAELAEPTEQAEASEPVNEPAETANADVETGNEE